MNLDSTAPAFTRFCASAGGLPLGTARLFTALQLLFVLSASRASGQASPLHLDGRLLPLGTDTFAVYLVQGGDTAPAGAVEDQLTVRGDTLIRIYTELNTAIGAIFDTIISSLSDLSPRAYHSRSSARLAQLRYDSTGVSGWLKSADGDSLVVAVTLPSPAYDGTTFDLIARASPLSDSFELAVPAYLYSAGRVETIHGGVVGAATLDGHPCWILEASFAGMPVTLWIDKTTRALRRQFLQLQPDAGLLYATPPRPIPDSQPS